MGAGLLMLLRFAVEALKMFLAPLRTKIGSG
jgi:hypothetical protein